MRIVCKNFWCKGTFIIPDEQYDENNPVSTCPKCTSFNNELSGGVSFVENKEYAGERFDGMPHREDIRIKKYDK